MDEAQVQLTDHQKLAQAARVTGRQYRLLPFESVQKVAISSDRVSVLVTTYAVTETATEYRLTQKGMKLITWKRHGHYGLWEREGVIVMWDEDYSPEYINKRGRIRSVVEQQEQIAWERDCYRPGTDKSPLDNYERVLAGETTKAMERYW